MQFDLKQPGALKKLSDQISSDIDAWCKEEYDDGFRNHLGASLIGNKCSRYLWYVFRWTFKEDFDPRMLRLFQRGHREEATFVQYLEGIGCKVWYENREGLMYHPESDSYWMHDERANDPDAEISHSVHEGLPNYLEHINRAKQQGIKFPQYRISGAKGHFGGSLDLIIELPERYGIPGRFLGECKTNGTGSPFNKLVSSGVQVAKPIHFSQMSTYGSHPNYNFEYGLYLNVNKNEDSLHVEFVKLDYELGARMQDKAERIIFSDVPPHKISNNQTYYECVYCPASNVCHKGAVPEKNCRSCKHAKPVDNAEWMCGQYGQVIPPDFIRSGCDSWHPITVKE